MEGPDKATEPNRRRPDPKPVLELTRELMDFNGPLEEFHAALLALQCRLVGASSGALVKARSNNSLVLAAIHPPAPIAGEIPAWLASASETASRALMAQRALAEPLHDPDALYDAQAARFIVAAPLGAVDGDSHLAVLVLKTMEKPLLEACLRQLELTAVLFDQYHGKAGAPMPNQHRQLRQAMEMLAALNVHERFGAAAMACCNEIAQRWRCDRVSLGFLRGQYVRLKAVSHAATFDKKAGLTQDLEAVMEECLDQDVEVSFPSAKEATYFARAAKGLSEAHGPTSVCSLPIRRRGKPVAVVTVERPADQPLDEQDIESIRLALELCAPRLTELHELDRWFGARFGAAVGKAFAGIVGPKHAFAKLATVAVCVGLLFLIFGQGQHKAEAPFILQAENRQVIPAPFDGFIKKVFVEPGEPVAANTTVLAELDVAELRLQLAAAQAEETTFAKKAASSLRDLNTAEAQIAKAQAGKVRAKIRLFEHWISLGKIASPIDGHVLTGDLKQKVGAPVRQGQILFEVAALESLRGELYVPDDEIADVEVGQTGQLATSSFPEERIDFVVERITPIAEVVNQRNVFKVRVRLVERRPWMRPGMEGVAKINIGRKAYWWILSRPLVNWVRMRLWL